MDVCPEETSFSTKLVLPRLSFSAHQHNAAGAGRYTPLFNESKKTHLTNSAANTRAAGRPTNRKAAQDNGFWLSDAAADSPAKRKRPRSNAWPRNKCRLFGAVALAWKEIGTDTFTDTRGYQRASIF